MTCLHKSALFCPKSMEKKVDLGHYTILFGQPLKTITIIAHARTYGERERRFYALRTCILARDY